MTQPTTLVNFNTICKFMCSREADNMPQTCCSTGCWDSRIFSAVIFGMGLFIIVGVIMELFYRLFLFARSCCNKEMDKDLAKINVIDICKTTLVLPFAAPIIIIKSLIGLLIHPAAILKHGK